MILGSFGMIDRAEVEHCRRKLLFYGGGLSCVLVYPSTPVLASVLAV